MPASKAPCSVLAGLTLLTAAGLLAQAPQFRATVDLLRLDVSVLDKKTRLPVRGLTAADFTILEDGHPQTVAAFSFIEIPDAPPAPIVEGHSVSWMRDVAPDVQTNASSAKPDSRLIVLLLDDAMIPFDPWIIQQTRKAARSVIDKLSPSDRVAVVLTAESVHAQDFTGDRERLLAAVERMRPGYATYSFGWDDYAPSGPQTLLDKDIGLREASLETLFAVGDALIAASDRRKMLVYISPGIPANPGWAATPRLADGSLLASYEANKKIVSDLPELFRRLRSANVTVYPIDPTGIAGMGAVVSMALEKAGVHGSASVDPLTGQTGKGAKSGAPPDPGAFGHFEATQDLNFLLAAAENTGGRAVVNTDDVEPGIRAMFAENKSFYLLGYQPPSSNRPGSLHRLQVRVSRPDVDVRTRSGYTMPETEKLDPRRPPPSPATKATAGLLQDGTLPLRAVAAAVAWVPKLVVDPALVRAGAPEPPDAHAEVAIVLGLERPALTRPIIDSVDVQIAAFTPDGVARGRTDQLATVTVRPATIDQPVRYEALSHISLKPGRYQLRIGAYSAVSDIAGSVYADVEVPDFSKLPLSLSGVLISTEPSLPSAPRDTLAALVPLVPTAERTFHKLDRVSAFVRVFQGGSNPAAAVALQVRVVDERGSSVVSKTETISSDRFGQPSHAADYRFEMPMLMFSRGQYLLTFEATAGKTISKREVRFAVE